MRKTILIRVGTDQDPVNPKDLDKILNVLKNGSKEDIGFDALVTHHALDVRQRDGMMLVLLGSDERPASPEDIEYTQGMMEEFKEEAESLNDVEVLVTNHRTELAYSDHCLMFRIWNECSLATEEDIKLVKEKFEDFGKKVNRPFVHIDISDRPLSEGFGRRPDDELWLL